jgi:putative endonuclease
VNSAGAQRGERWWVYVVRCGDGTLYCGATNDVPARVAAHDEGRGAKYTRGRRPVRLIFSRRFGGKAAAFREEARIKRLTRAEKLAMVQKKERR